MTARKPVRVLVLIWLAAILSAYVVPFAAIAAPVTTVDENGANDEPGQKDLTLHSVDTAGLPTSINVTWNWDDTAWSGSNTGDACALFDNNSNGKADKAVCVTVHNSPAVQATNSPRVYTCGDGSAQKCTGSVLVSGTTTTCTVAITADQPFATGDSTPNDTKASCHIVMADVGGITAKLINTCSYPSEQPNSDPSDCVLIPRDALLTVVKVASPNDGTPFPFLLDGAAFATINGSGSSGAIPVKSGSRVLKENVPSGWALGSISCTGGGPVYANPQVTLTLASDQSVTCTFNDTKNQPSLTVLKQLVSNTDEDGSGSVTLNDTLNYKIMATNNGNVTLTGVTVTDSLIGTLSCTPAVPATLAPAASVVCTGSHKVTQAEVNAGQVVNTGTADSDQTTPVTSSVTVPITRTAAIQVDKAGTINLGANGTLNAGDVINYSITVKNTGNVTLNPVTVTDPKVTNLSCPATSLAPSAQMICTASHTITQADIDAGKYDNTATGTGTPPTGGNVTDTGDASVPLSQTASIAVDKSGTLSKGDDNVANVGDVISYQITVQNTGNVTLNPVTVTDPKVTNLSCPATSLAPGAQMICTASHTLTQADVDAGKYDNTATGTGTKPGGGTVTDTGDASVPIAQGAAIDVTKAGVFNIGSDNKANPGDTISYSVTVKNTGNVTLSSVTATDPKVTLVCPQPTLAPGASEICTGTYTVTQADIDAGKVDNTATGTGTPPTGGTVTDTGSTTVTIPQAASIAVDKSGLLALGNDNTATPGDVITYSVVVKNDGNVTLTSITVGDPLVTNLSCPQTTLAPGAQMTCSGTYAITQADIDAGKVDNTATGTGTKPGGGTVTDTGSTTVPIPSSSSILVTKKGTLNTGGDGIPNAGDTISYTVTIKNTGNTTLTNVSASDPLVTLVCPSDTLAPGASEDCTATYTITQADIDAGKVVNTATGCGTPPNAGEICDDDTTTTPITQTPSIAVDKVGVFDPGTDNIANPGDTISYTVTVKNTGNVTLDPVTVTDPLITLVCPATKLAPGASEDCTATYVITQADIDAGKVDNTATGTGKPPTGDNVTDTGDSSVPITQGASISVDKTGVLDLGTDGVATPGDLITYTVAIKNTGNVTLTSITATDPKVTLTCPQPTLAPGASENCTGTYAITQADIDNGSVDNTATGTGTKPGGGTVTDTGSTTVPIPEAGSIDVTKSGSLDVGTDGVATVGDVITYTVTAKNTGNVTLDPVVVSDPKVPNLTCDKTKLAPGESTTCTGTYAITQADIDAGKVDNTATGTGTKPGGGTVTDTGSTTVTISRTGSIMVVKTGTIDLGDDHVANPGDEISYTVTLTNTGNVTLTNVTATDPLVTLVCPSDTLAPGASEDCTATYVITQADIDAGKVDNTATGTGTTPGGGKVTDDDSTTVPIPQSGSIAVDKSGSLDTGTDGVATPGDLITYTVTATNDGNVTLDPVVVSDPKVTNLTCDKTKLAPGESTTCTGTYAITQADIDAGKVDNTATGTGTKPDETTVTDTGTATVPITRSSAILVTKKGTLNLGENQTPNPGDTISYTVTIKNTGNATLTNVSATDTLVTLVCPSDTLAPGASEDCTATYTITQADIDAGQVVNTATGCGTPPNADQICDDDTHTTPIPQTNSILVVKKGTLNLGDDNTPNPGDTISYTVTISNTGNTTLTNVSASDPKVTLVCPSDTLAPSASEDCTASYTITQADIDAGQVVNTATGCGTPPKADEICDDDTNTTPIPQNGAIAVDKSGSLDLGTDNSPSPGDVITYTVTVKNTGTVTLDPVVVSDPKVADLTCDKTKLAPGETATCSGTYAITQADIDAGKVDNTATGTGTKPDGTTVTDTGDASVPINQGASIQVDKTGTLAPGTDGVATPGDVITYTVTVKNIGNVTLDPVSVSDPKVGLTCEKTKLAPGESMTCTGTYAITQPDIDAGKVDNTATGTGKPPTGSDVTDTGDATVPLTSAASIQVDKSGSLDLGADNAVSVGDVITYTVTAKNTGNVTLDPVVVSDPKVPNLTCDKTKLAPGETTTCTGTYAITQADIDAGKVDNTATGTGKPPTGNNVSDTGDATVPLGQSASISVDKSGVLAVGDDNVATPGDVITYTVTVKNTGNVTLDPVMVSDPKVPNLTCDKTKLAPGESTTCTGTYAITQADIDAGKVDNTATGTGTKPDGGTVTDTGDATVPLPHGGDMTVTKGLTKNADENGDGIVDEGDTITYTITVTNTGNTTLTGVTASDPIPSGTTFSSCDPTCSTDGPPVTQASWTLAPIQPGHSASVTLSVRVGQLSSCTICNTASADSDQTDAHSSPQLCITAGGSAHPEGAHANGSALAAKVVLLNLPLLGNINQTIAPTSSSQTGIGADSHSAQVLTLAVPPPAGAVAKAGLLTAESTSIVFPTAGASDTGTAETLGVNLLGGAITADVVRAVAFAQAGGNGANISSLGSTFKNLKVNGVAFNGVAPNTTVNLPAALFGTGSFVRLYERIGGTDGPDVGQTSGGTYRADLSVNMIHVFVRDALPLVPGNQTAEIIVSGAVAHADFPQTTVCFPSGLRTVSGHAFIADAVVYPVLGVNVGYVIIPRSGGSSHAHLQSARVPEPGGAVASTGVVETDSTGAVTPTFSVAQSYAQAADVCVLNMGGGCTIGATLIKSKANSRADAAGASSSDIGTTFVGLQVLGTPINGTPPPNTVINLPGIGFVILNEQYCDGAGVLPSCAGPAGTGLTVRAIRVVITNPVVTQNLGIGIQVIVAEAHSDATWHADPSA